MRSLPDWIAPLRARLCSELSPVTTYSKKLDFSRKNLGTVAPLHVLSLIGPWLLMAAAWSCGPQMGESGAPASTPVLTTYESGTVAVTIEVNAGNITVADQLELAVEVIAGEQQRVVFPDVEDKLGEFRVTGTRVDDPKLLDGGRVARRQTYVLEPFLPGEYEIPELTIGFSGEGGGEDSQQSIKTDPIGIEVRSLLPDSEEEPDIKEASGPLEMPGVDAWVYWLAGAAVFIAAAAGYFLWRRRRAKARIEEIPSPPHEVAYRELDALLAENLIGRGLAKLFYVRLSNILRHYIENRFGLRAPESTTEEFLIALRGSAALEQRHKDLLRRFLEHCDLVKFAKLKPSGEEIEGAVTSCREFIKETEPSPAIIPDTLVAKK